MRLCYTYGRFFAPYGNDEKHETDDEHDGKRADPKALISGHIGHDADQQRTHERRALAENIVNAEIFPCFLRRNDFRKIRARHSLNGTLKQPDADGKDPEFIDLIEKHRIDRNKEIRDDTRHDQVLRLYLPRKHSQKDRRRECDDLRYEQSDQKHGRIQSQRRTVSGRHIDDRIDAVDKEEKGDQKEKDFFIPRHFFEHAAEIFQPRTDGVSARFDKMFLPITFPKRERTADPPHRNDHEHKQHRGKHTQKTEHGIQDINDDSHQKGRTAADITPGITAGRNFVHTVGLGDIAEHGVINDQAERISRFCQHEQH